MIILIFNHLWYYFKNQNEFWFCSVCSDETISHSGGYRPNVEFNPDPKALRSVIYGPNFNRFSSNITTTALNFTGNPDLIKYLENTTYDVSWIL